MEQADANRSEDGEMQQGTHEKSVSEIDFSALMAGRKFYPSPEEWVDQVLYFLLIDRFSDGNERGYKSNSGRNVLEGSTPPFDRKKDTNCAVADEASAARWRDAGHCWVGGNLKGLRSKLGYLQRMGVTAVWVSPILQQCARDDYSYHGYGIQNFLEVDPHFGTREDFRDFVAGAHAMGIYVVLDVILNHSGNVFAYAPDRYKESGDNGKTYFDTRWDGREYGVKGFRDRHGRATLPFGPIDLNHHPSAYPQGAIWPIELQAAETFTRKGHIANWDSAPEYQEGDFFDLKDIALGGGGGDHFQPSPALRALCAVYKFWLAYADLDGFRVDTVKHMEPDATRYFVDEIHAFAQSVGKKNFCLIGEIAGGRANAVSTLHETGLDAALGVDEIPTRIRDLIAGRGGASEFFRLFDNGGAAPVNGWSDEAAWALLRVVIFFDDHDQIGRPVKGRLAAEYGGDRSRAESAVIAALGINLTASGIPCIYYGTEQALDGHALTAEGDDRYTREAMFGGEFGAFGSRGRHVFSEKSRVYRELSKLSRLRAEIAALRRGDEYLREVQSGDDQPFQYPECGAGREPYRGLIAWSRLRDGEEVVCVVNTDPMNPHSAWVTVDGRVHPPGSHPLRCLYSTDGHQIGGATAPPEALNGSAVCLTVPAAGFAVFG
jgi:glycosidase